MFLCLVVPVILKEHNNPFPRSLSWNEIFGDIFQNACTIEQRALSLGGGGGGMKLHFQASNGVTMLKHIALSALFFS